MRTKRAKKTLTDQAAELVEQVQPHVEAARERIVNDYLPAAQSMLADARDIDLEKAAQYPYKPASLPVNRLRDGTMFHW